LSRTPLASARLRDELAQLLHTATLRPGDRLPGETELAARHGVGRSTVREALKLLEQEGLVVSERGRGWFVATLAALHVERPITRFESMSTMLAGLGYRSVCTVLSVQEQPADDAVRTALDLPAGEPVIRLERLRSADDRPLVYAVETIPRRCLPGPLQHVDWSASLTGLLGAQGFPTTSSVAALTAAQLPDDAEQRYSLAGLGPWLLITETAVTPTGLPVIHSAGYHRGDCFRFNVVRR